MRSFALTAAVALVFLACAADALAGWSAPRVLSRAHYSAVAIPVVAVDARGDAAVAWETVGSWPKQSHGRRCSPSPTRRSCFPVSSIHLAVRSASGQLLTRTLWSSRINPTIVLSVVLGHGEATLAWGFAEPAADVETVRVAYGPLNGRWAPSRAIGSFWGPTPFLHYPQLAIAADGEVTAAWNGCSSEASGGGYSFRPRGGVVAWRAPGHGFGAAQRVAAAPLGAAPQFDTRGTAYLDSSCSGRILIAQAHSHRFRRSVVLAAGPVLSLTLSLAGPGQGLAAWIAGSCSYDEAVGSTPGPVLMSVLHAGAFAKPQMLSSASTQALYSNVVAVSTGGTASWLAAGGPLGFTESTLQIAADGVPGPTQQANNEVIALTADGGGDVVLSGARGFGRPPNVVLVRPVGGGADQPSPVGSGELAAATPIGRAVALAAYAGPATLEVSVWRPCAVCERPPTQPGAAPAGRFPPATAGRIVTSDPSATAVSSPSRKRMSSPATYTLTNRRSEPSSSAMRARSSPKRSNSPSRTSCTVAPSTSASASPSAAARSWVGIFTTTVMRARSRRSRTAPGDGRPTPRRTRAWARWCGSRRFPAPRRASSGPRR